MAVIHRTSLTPTKLELLAAWLPTQPWYAGTEGAPKLTKAGGFRLDDPNGEVGIEFMVALDESGDRPVAYLVPLSYRGAPLEGADDCLIGTAEHGVLGRRWVYDGTHDPVLVGEIVALLEGRATPQAQSVSDTPDPSVTATLVGGGLVGSPTVVNGPDGTDLVADDWTIHVVRVLDADERSAATVKGQVTAGWRLPGDQEVRGTFFVVR